MNNMSLREKAVMAVVVMLALYAVAVASWFLSQEAAWSKAAKAYDRARTAYQKEQKLIAEKQKWADAYEDEKAQMPTFEFGKSTDTTWLQKMDEIAARRNIVISQRQGGKEIEKGDVLELPIEVRSWEGALKPLVEFMHELENSEEGMFDISSLSFKPSNKKGYFKGSFTLTCAYMREN